MKKVFLISTILTLLFISGISNALFAQNVFIPDPVFKSALVSDLGINTNADTNIQVSEAIAYTGGMYLGEYGIADLTGIEAFVNLTELDCGTNYLTTLDLSANIALQTLTCSMNSLTSLDLSANVNLYSISCGGNMLTSLNVSNNAALQALYCENNSLTSLDLSGNPALLNIYCPDNQLTNLDLSSNPLLTSVGCSYNLLTCVDVSANPNVSSVYCDNNLLNSLNLKNGNNTNFTGLNALGNPGLTCAQVDNVAYANTNWVGLVDALVTFNTDCGQPIASFSANDPVCFGTPVTFTDGSTLTTKWLWDFGNGVTSTFQNPNYVYPTGGNFNVTLEASSCYGSDVFSVFVVQGQDILGNASYTMGPVTDGWTLIYPYQSFYTSFDTLQIQPLNATTGDFQFLNIPDGDYLVQVFANPTPFPTLSPTYYDNDWAWDSAIVITHGCTSPTTAVNITMTELPTLTTGIGTLHGNILEGPGFGRAQGDPVPGVVVKRGISATSQIVETTTTDINGEYQFNNVDFGSYTIFVDITGLLRDSSYNITLDAANNQFLNLDYVVDSTSIYIIENIGIEEELNELYQLEVYPNPVKSNANIEYTLVENAKVSLSIYNVLGVKVHSIVNASQEAGKYKFNFDPLNNDIGSGVYFVSLSVDGKQVTKSLLVVE